MHSVLKLLFGFTCLLWPMVGPSQALDPPRFNYARTLWRVSDGLPEDTIQALAESSSGLLWIGTTGGLATFDGSQIRIFGHERSLSANSIFALAMAPDQSLWVGTEGGGLLHIEGDRVSVLSARQGLTDQFVRSVMVDHLGRVWAGTDDGLFIVEGSGASRWARRIDGTPALPALAVHSIIEDRDHRVWAGGSRLIALSPDGRAREYSLPGAYSKNRVKKLLQTADGTIWVGTVGGLQRLAGSSFQPVPEIHATIRTMLQAADGTLWVGTIGDGLWLFQGQAFSRVQQSGLLPSDTVLSLFQDRQKQIWIGSQAGLVRLSKTVVTLIRLPEGSDPDFETISGDPRGDIWVAAQHLYMVRNGAAIQTNYPGLGRSRIRNVFRASNGDLWFGTDGSGAYRLRANGAVVHYTAPAVLTNNFIRGLLEARNGDIWIATDEGVTRISSTGFERLTEAEGLAFFSTRSLLEDHTGGIWIGTDRGLSLWRNGAFEHNPAVDQLATEKIWAILEDRLGTLWFGSRDHGLFRYRDGILERFTTDQGLPSNSIYQLLEDRTGAFWLTGPNTIASITAEQMNSLSATSEQSLSVVVYAMPFGGDGAQMYGGREPAGYLAPDDSVWFPTTRGVAHLLSASHPAGQSPVASLNTVEEDGRRVEVKDALDVPAHVGRLSFSFSAISLRSQIGVRFRYKLENFDKDWIAAGSDRVVSYTNLPAGKYRFRVVAYDRALPAITSEASIEFTKEPYFYQGWRFYVLLSFLLVGIIFAMYELRVRRIRMRFADILSERNRLAREMHDTVIQGCTGISALLEAIATTPGQTEATALLNYARQQAQTTINEARDAVWNMRHERESDVDLVQSIAGIAQQTTRDYGTLVTFSHHVQELTVRASAAHEILMTAREAVYNSVQHSGTNVVTVELDLRGEFVDVAITDRGCGMVRPLHETQEDGHFGLIGMRERMQRVGGKLDLTSHPGLGTRVHLSVRRTAKRSEDGAAAFHSENDGKDL
jgi:ligand-binding sensor domain-containing protein/signal transduction histidine kinase